MIGIIRYFQQRRRHKTSENTHVNHPTMVVYRNGTTVQIPADVYPPEERQIRAQHELDKIYGGGRLIRKGDGFLL